MIPTKRKYPKSMSEQVWDVMRTDWGRGQDLRAQAIDIYLADLDRLERQGKRGEKYWNFIVRELQSLGYDMDYSPTDGGNYYESRK